jgi:hypothetical protein
MLDAADCPQEGRALIVDAYGAEDLRQIDTFVRYDASGVAGNVSEGIFGKRQGSIFGMPVYISNNLGTTSVVGGTLVRGLMIHTEAFALAMQKNSKVETWRNAPQLADELIGQALYGVAEYRDTFGVVISYPKA